MHLPPPAPLSVSRPLQPLALLAVLAALRPAPGRGSPMSAIPGDNDPHPGVRRARALPIQGLDVARYQGRIDFDAVRAGGVAFRLS